MAYIEVANLFKKFDKGNVLDDVSFTIHKQDRFGLIGPNGAGKSTLIDIMTGILQLDAGDIIVDGISVKEDIKAIRQKIGLVPQDLALMEDLNALDNLEYFGAMYGLHGKKLKERMDYALKFTGLEEKKKEKVKKYSGGMKRRLNIACAILHEPELLILDEPTVGVDPQSRKYIFDFMKHINEEQKATLLFTSHYMEEVEALCNRIFIIDMGKEVAYGTKEEIKSMIGQGNKIKLALENPSDNIQEKLREVAGVSSVDYDLKEFTLLIDNKKFDMMKLIAFLETQEQTIKSVYVDEVSLEEAFLALTGKKLRD